jgi:chitinase
MRLALPSTGLITLALASLVPLLAACGNGDGGAGGSGGASNGTGATGTGSGAGTGTAGTSSTSASTGSGGAGSGRWVTGYYVGYQSTLYPPSAIDFSALSHLVIGPVTPHADGSLDASLDVDPAAAPALIQDLVTRAHGAQRKALFMLGGAGAHDAWVGAASAGTRATFVQNLVTLATTSSIDGFDLDWEPLDPADYPAFQALAQDLRAALPGTILTVPVGWVSSTSPSVDSFYSTIAPVFDQINVMSYGMAGDWPGWKSWHSAALHGETPTTPTSVDSTVKAYLAAGVPAAKLGIGIGFYGTCWTPPVSGPSQDLGGSTVAASDNAMSYTNIMADYFSAGARQWDDTAKATYLSFGSATGPSGCGFVSYEDEQSIAEKAAYAKAEGLGGAIIWTINQGYLPSAPAGMQNPVLDAVGQGFLH